MTTKQKRRGQADAIGYFNRFTNNHSAAYVRVKAWFSESLKADKHRAIRVLVKTLIVRLALMGVLPVAVAEWLIQRGGLRHV